MHGPSRHHLRVRQVSQAVALQAVVTVSTGAVEGKDTWARLAPSSKLCLISRVMIKHRNHLVDIKEAMSRRGCLCRVCSSDRLATVDWVHTDSSNTLA